MGRASTARRRAHASASPPPTGATAPQATSPGPASLYILGPGRDLGLILATPLWILPLVFVGASFTGDRQVNDAVFALGAIGHHLPGMLRAYGDRAVFSRFRARLTLGPLVLFALCVPPATQGTNTLVAIAFLWGVWHALAQCYGFVRIYSAKAGAGDRWSAWADRLLLIAWFLLAIVHSPLRLTFLLETSSSCGVPLPSAAAIAATRAVVTALAGAATAFWLGVVVVQARRGHGPGAMRLAMLASSIGIWWFANVRVRHTLLAAPLFELFHDAQYLAIVWAFNRRRADDPGAPLAAPLRALFRPTFPSVAAYLAACAAYGALFFYQPHAPTNGAMVAGHHDAVVQALTLVAATSQLLHFYLDGFIWKMREEQTARVVGVQAVQRREWLGPWWPVARHALLWLLILVPYGALWAGESRAALPTAMSEDDRVIAISDRVPDYWLYRYSAAERRWRRGDRQAGLEGLRAALALDPSQVGVRRNLALSLCELADEAEAEGDRPRLVALARELDQVRVGLEEPDAEFARRHLEGYKSTLAASRGAPR